VVLPDVLRGGAGDDAYVVLRGGIEIVENAGEGTDTVRSNINYTLSPELENLILSSGALNGVGNALANHLSGNAAANLLDGGLGNDTMAGGPGDDTYIADSTNDTIIENASEGTDLVRATASYILSANVENLILIGNGAASGTGNAQANTLTGNSLANVLDGDAGNDILLGNQGDDILFGGANDDALHGGSGNDMLLGDRGESSRIGSADTLIGGVGNDQLDGGAGVDLLFGNDWGSGASIAGAATSGGDLFVYTQTDDKGDLLFGFDTTPVLGENDGIDLRPLFDALGYAGTTPRSANMLRLVQSGADSLVQIDPDGVLTLQDYTTLLTLMGVTASTLTDNFFLFQ
jgi:Ca2+-binding RTX toxin-like protein